MNGEELDPALVDAITAALKAQNKEKEKSNVLNTVAVQNATRELELAKEIHQNAIASGNLAAEELARLEKYVETQERGLNRVKKAQENLNKLADNAPDVLKGIFSGDASGQASKGLNSLGSAIEKKLTNNMKSAFKSADTFGKGLKAAAGPAAALAIVLLAAEMLKLAIQIGNAENAFMKVTGANREFARSVSNSYGETRKFGGSVDDVNKSMQSLYTGFTDFTFQDAKTRESLTNTATVLEKLGVSNQDFATSIQTMTKAMGMSVDAAGQQMLNLEKFAEELGVAPSKLASDFAGAGNMLAKMGDQGVGAFKDLQIASKITGLEMQKILNIVDNFDTFEGAAAQAGKLNAALGGNFVNAMDLMMETDPAERFGMIRDSILDAGLSFDEMSYYQKNFYKEALGLQDVGDLALMLSGNMDSIPGAIQKTSQEYEEAADRAKEVASFQEQLNLLFAELIPIVTPLVDMMRTFLGILQPMAPAIGVVSKSLGGLLVLGSPLYGLSQLFRILSGDVDGAMDSFKGLIDMIFHVSNSPTFFEGLGMMPGMFSDVGDGIDGASASMRGMRTTMESTPIPAAAETMAGTSNNRGGATSAITSGGNGGMQTVRQPVEISLNGDKLEKFIVEATGKFIKSISLVQ